MINRILALVLLWIGCSGAVWTPLLAVDPIEKEFANPPDAARPHAFWYWIDGNVTREGIAADLEAMKRAGIGGVELYNIGGHGSPGPVKIMSPEWRELMRYAITKAGQLGLEVDLNNSPGGWSSSGGPWITPEISMQKLTWSEAHVQGGKLFEGTLPQPATNEGYYRDVAVLAFPTPEPERLPQPVSTITSSDPGLKGAALIDGSESTVATLAKPAVGQTAFVELRYPQPILARSLRIAPRKYGTVPKGKLLASEDGKQWRELLAFPKGRGWASLDVVFASTTALAWRIEFEGQEEVALAEITLSPRYRIAEWTGKAIFDQYGLDKPPFAPAALAAPAECCIRLDSILDLSSKMDAAGRLNWEVPAGDWTVLRFGHTATGQHTGPAGPGSDGLECDKFDPASLDVHWANGMATFFNDKELNPHIQYVHVDSYEKGAQNWSRNFPQEFRQRCGYDVKRYLPAITGRVVENLESSERFLWDFRQTCCGLMAENYFGHMRELCHRHGKQFTLEPYHQVQFKSVTAGGAADVPMCEFWTGGLPGPYWYKLGASPAHVYGRNIVGAESFTAPRQAGGNYTTDPWALKTLGDLAFCGGVNRYVFHVYVMQPWLDRKPGMTLAAFGTHFERTNTWFDQMPAYTRYIARCQQLLRQGRFVADLLYFGGENAPDDGFSPGGVISVPSGYDYDVCDEQVLRQRITVRDGRLVLPEGISYRLLVLPLETRMTPELLRRVRELVDAGATVVGPKPQGSPSLARQPSADGEVRKLAAEIWADCDGTKATEHAFGKGRVFWGKPVKEILASLNAAPDFERGQSPASINYIHRQLDQGDLYFVASTSDQPVSADCTFRVDGKQPELWNPLTGEITPLPVFRELSGRMVVPLEFAPRGSWFVLFQKKTGDRGPKTGKTTEDRGLRTGRTDGGPKTGELNFPVLKPVMELTGAWDVQFDPKWGGPAKPVLFPDLSDWSTSPDPGIKYYSGKATYRISFDVQAVLRSLLVDPQTRNAELRTKNQAPPNRLYLDLGLVKNVAEVRLNGKPLGIVWCAPWRVEVTGVIQPTANQLEVDLVNLWPNRMIGDEQLPDDCEWQPSGHGGKELKRFPDWLLQNQPRPSGRFTFSSWKHFAKDDALLPSGLLGPVTIYSAVSP